MGRIQKSGVYAKHARYRPISETAFRAWMDAMGKGTHVVGRELGVHHEMVQFWADNQQLPSLIDAFKVEKLTGGKVPVASWLGTPLGKVMWSERTKKK